MAQTLTKWWVVDYYRAVAPVLVPHLRDHPLTLHRSPDGVDGVHWYETRAPAHPDWVRTVTFHVRTTGNVFDVCVLDDLPALVWAAQIAAVELTRSSARWTPSIPPFRRVRPRPRSSRHDRRLLPGGVAHQRVAP